MEVEESNRLAEADDGDGDDVVDDCCCLGGHIASVNVKLYWSS